MKIDKSKPIYLTKSIQISSGKANAKPIFSAKGNFPTKPAPHAFGKPRRGVAQRLNFGKRTQFADHLSLQDP